MLKIYKPDKDPKVFFKLIIDPEISNEDIESIKKMWTKNKDNYIITDKPFEVTMIELN